MAGVLRSRVALTGLAPLALIAALIAAFAVLGGLLVALAVLMPIVASTGGNAGTQTMAVTVRALAMERLGPVNTPRVITRGFACLEGVFEPKDRVPHQVRVFSLDDYCSSHGITRIAFLKLDIEGSELKALRGATRLLSEHAIRTILVETSLEAHLRPNAEAIDELLRSAGCRSHRAKRNGALEPIDVLDQRELPLGLGDPDAGDARCDEQRRATGGLTAQEVRSGGRPPAL